MELRVQQIVGLGTLVIFIGFMIVFIGAFLGAKETNTKTKVAVGGFIGPIPFGFGNDRNLVWLVTALSVIIFTVWMFLSYRIK